MAKSSSTSRRVELRDRPKAGPPDQSVRAGIRISLDSYSTVEETRLRLAHAGGNQLRRDGRVGTKSFAGTANLSHS